MTAVAVRGLDPCVHCGFCLQACPTYLATGDEADGPRGRIVLMQGLANGRLAPTDPALAYHLDRCLGCRACEPVCPSGVSYGPALEEARHTLGRSRPVPLAARMVHAVMAEPALRRPLLWAARMVRPVARWLAGDSRLGFVWGMVGATKTQRGQRGQRGHKGQKEQLRPAPPAPPVSPFTGCIMEGLFSHVHAATERVLMVNGYRMEHVRDQMCCGALHAHAGQHEQALALARRNVRAFAARPQGMIAVNAAGCGAMLKEYARLLEGDSLAVQAKEFSSRVKDVTELLAERGPRRGAPLRLRAAYDPPCHLLHAQGIAEAPEAVLHAVPGLTRVYHAEAEVCCGSAGSYSLVEPELSREVLARKVAALAPEHPDVVVSGNPGCVMQIGAGLTAAGLEVDVVHPVEILDWSYWEAGFYGR